MIEGKKRQIMKNFNGKNFIFTFYYAYFSKK